MVNILPCIVWPLAILAAIVSFRMWQKRRGIRYAWLMPVVFFAGVLLILWSVVRVQFEVSWWDGLFSLYIPQ